MKPYGAAATKVKVLGTVSHCIYRKDDYSILRVKTDSGECVIKGTMPEFSRGVAIVAECEQKLSKKYGMELHVNNIYANGFGDKDALMDHLSGPEFPGIGKVTAKAIIDHFGLEAVDILDKDPTRLLEVDGIGKIRGMLLANHWAANRIAHRITTDLARMHVPAKLAMKAYKEWKESAPETVRNNPYALLRLDHASFEVVDKIALMLGVPKDSPNRIAASAIYTLQKASFQYGHCFLPVTTLRKHMIELLRVDIGDVAWIMAQITKYIGDGIVFEEDRAYLRSLYNAEMRLAKNIRKFKAPALYTEEEIRDLVEDMKLGFDLSDEQFNAIVGIMTNPVSIITGPAGSGKTTIMQVSTRLLKRKSQEITMCAPTGRAAKRLSEVTGHPAATIHRTIEFSVSGQPNFNAENPLKTDCLKIEESSMMDIFLADHVFEAVDDYTRIVVIGDKNQLPSVGPGYVLNDLIESNICHVSRLTKIYRQDVESSIVSVANDILEGNIPDIPALDGALKDGACRMYDVSSTDEALLDLQKIIKQLSTSLNISLSDVKVLSPMKKHALGIYSLNEVLQAAFNINAQIDVNRIKIGNTVFAVDDPVMQLRNDYNKGTGVFNGDIGRIASIVNVGDYTQLVVEYPEHGELIYESADFDDLQLAYASTVHKFQGSQAPATIVILHDSHSILLRRQILYTALTRAQNACIILGTRSALKRAVDNDIESKRFTTLSQRLNDEIQSAQTQFRHRRM